MNLGVTWLELRSLELTLIERKLLFILSTSLCSSNIIEALFWLLLKVGNSITFSINIFISGRFLFPDWFVQHNKVNFGFFLKNFFKMFGFAEIRLKKELHFPISFSSLKLRKLKIIHVVLYDMLLKYFLLLLLIYIHHIYWLNLHLFL